MIVATAPFRTQDLDLPGVTLHVSEAGDPDAPAVVWLHGMLGHAYEWDTATAGVAERFRVVAIEQRGHGRSSHPGDYRLSLLVADMTAALDRLELERPHLVGHSMGGLVATVLAGQQPWRVDRLVLLDIGPDSLTTSWGREQLPAILRRFVGMTFHDVDEATDAWLAEDPLADRGLLRHYVAHALVPTGTGRYRWCFDAGGLDTFLAHADPSELWTAVDRVRAPTLLVRGEHSHLLSPSDARRVVDRLAHGRLLEIAGASHDLGVQQPVAVAEACLAWLARAETGPGSRHGVACADGDVRRPLGS